MSSDATGEPSNSQVAIVPLTRNLNRESFDCGVAEMNSYLRQYALQNEENHLSRTRVAVTAEQSGESRIVGF